MVLEKRIESIDVGKWNELKGKKIELYQKWEYLDSSAKYPDFSELIEFWNKNSNWDDSMENLQNPVNLKSAYELLQIVKNGGIRLKSLIESEKIERSHLMVERLLKKN